MESTLVTADAKPKTAPKDFFLHLGVMAALYAVLIALLNLLFRVINIAFPQILDYEFRPSSSISLQVAVLIIVFPLLVALSLVANRLYLSEPEKRQLWVRRWLWMLTLFVAGIALVGDLVTLLYYFLDGRELTTAFILKVLAVLIVSAGVFGYVLQDLRDQLSRGGRRVWVVIAAAVLLLAIIAGFSVIGSPRTQRLRRYDDQKIMDLQNIQWQVINYWQSKGRMPRALADLTDPLAGQVIPKDRQNGKAYEYILGERQSFQLCADFNLRSPEQGTTLSGKPIVPVSATYRDEPINENWQHAAGRHCFQRVIDSERYPISRPGVKGLD